MISDLVHPQTFPNLFPVVKRFGKVEDGLCSLLNTLYQILNTFILWELCVYFLCDLPNVRKRLSILFYHKGHQVFSQSTQRFLIKGQFFLYLILITQYLVLTKFFSLLNTLYQILNSDSQNFLNFLFIIQSIKEGKWRFIQKVIFESKPGRI